ncbi:MAG: glutamate 5-kinase [Acidimicrobiales bacterium]
MIVVAKIGTTSLTDDHGEVDRSAIARLGAQVAAVRALGHTVVLVTSGAIAAGMPRLAMTERPEDPVTLQALSAVGQSHLMGVYDEVLGGHGIVGGQVLLAPDDFFDRARYLRARGTLERLLELGVVPIINENDAVADDAIRFGDNDRIAALLAHLVGAEMLVLLTDMAGVFTVDPRRDPDASLIAEIAEVDDQLEAVAGGGSRLGSGGMASKLSAAKIASWSGVTTVIAAADRPNVLVDAVTGRDDVGTTVRARAAQLPARRLWIAFAVRAAGRVAVDAGARRALVERGTSLLPVGVTSVEGDFGVGDAVEVVGPDGSVFAKGLVAVTSVEMRAIAGQHSDENLLPDEVIHRDDLVVLP